MKLRPEFQLGDTVATELGEGRIVGVFGKSVDITFLDGTHGSMEVDKLIKSEGAIYLENTGLTTWNHLTIGQQSDLVNKLPIQNDMIKSQVGCPWRQIPQGVKDIIKSTFGDKEAFKKSLEKSEGDNGDGGTMEDKHGNDNYKNTVYTKNKDKDKEG